jgi:hypothetical protein
MLKKRIIIRFLGTFILIHTYGAGKAKYNTLLNMT